jgi:hypothetical protein
MRSAGMPAAGSAVLAQAGTLGITNCRRHRPFWITSGTLVVAGMLGIVKVPSYPVTALTSGEPETSAPQLPHETPDANGSTAELGTYTSVFGSGSTPFGAYTVPWTLVVAVPVHATCERQRPVQFAEIPQTFPMHIWLPEHVPHWTIPPQPSLCAPQVAPSCPQVLGVHTVTHWPALHAWLLAQLPQLRVPMHPSPCIPQA